MAIGQIKNVAPCKFVIAFGLFEFIPRASPPPPSPPLRALRQIISAFTSRWRVDDRTDLTSPLFFHEASLWTIISFRPRESWNCLTRRVSIVRHCCDSLEGEGIEGRFIRFWTRFPFFVSFFSSIPSSPFLVAFLYFKSISRSPTSNRHMKVCSSEGSETRLVKLDGLEARYGGGMAKPLYSAIFHFIGA